MLDFRTIDENELHGTGRRIENASEGITLQIVKKEESAKMFMKEPHTALFVAPTGVEKPHLALSLLETEYRNHFNFIVKFAPL